tara:strand:+ start:6129 stop:6431 length:303 start_codon:yes stop_codon:yes gene_type:complete
LSLLEFGELDVEEVTLRALDPRSEHPRRTIGQPRALWDREGWAIDAAQLHRFAYAALSELVADNIIDVPDAVGVNSEQLRVVLVARDVLKRSIEGVVGKN